jgi:ATP-binding cassette subfamily B protein
MNPTPNKISFFVAAQKLAALMKADRKNILIALFTMIIGSGLNLAAPYLFGRAVDQYVRTSNYPGILTYAGILLATFVVAFVCQYVQMQLMGTVGQRVLFRLRNDVFTKLQELPIAFFNRNKSGDLISRINNDTDKLNQFFSETLVRFVGSIFMILGTGIFIIAINARLGLVALVPALTLFVLTQALSGWVKNRTATSLQKGGSLSAEIQESLDNFKVIVAFNRRDYFRNRFQEANVRNFSAAIHADIANGIFMPMYDAASTIAQFIVVGYGTVLISRGALTLGVLLSFLLYIERFYMPLRQIATFWSSFQLALAGWDRVSEILHEREALPTLPIAVETQGDSMLEFKDVHFRYMGGAEVLRKANFALLPGKTYALVGPTGGGKTTTASLMARLYDPTEGKIFLNGRDIRSYETSVRTQKIGFILQEPFLFTGTILENIFFGNELYAGRSNEELMKALDDAGLGGFVSRFDKALETSVSVNGNSMSLGERQLIAFMRAVMRKPDILILDEATANIDTVTEQLLEETLTKLPPQTTKVIIAHRLNTIENADEIFFVNGGEITSAGSFDHAVDMLMHGKRAS